MPILFPYPMLEPYKSLLGDAFPRQLESRCMTDGGMVAQTDTLALRLRLQLTLTPSLSGKFTLCPLRVNERHNLTRWSSTQSSGAATHSAPPVSQHSSCLYRQSRQFIADGGAATPHASICTMLRSGAPFTAAHGYQGEYYIYQMQTVP